jgi:hypothetical protein
MASYKLGQQRCVTTKTACQRRLYDDKDNNNNDNKMAVAGREGVEALAWEDDDDGAAVNLDE